MYKRYISNFQIDQDSPFYDVVVVGAGAAGLFASLTIRPDLKVLVIAKEGLRDCNSQLAQGGIAITLDSDYESHVTDTLKAGSFYNDEEVVRKMIGMSKPVFDELINLGAKFDMNEDGTIAKTAEGGHRKRRIIHAKDATGEAVMTALIESLPKRSNISVKSHAHAIDIVTETALCTGSNISHEETTNQEEIIGAERKSGQENELVAGKKVIGLVFRNAKGRVEAVKCDHVILATGGIGGLFEATTNVAVNKGDGMAMAIRAGAAMRDAEFIQFHPTAMALKSGGYFLISEAVRGEGGHLINNLGERFMDGKHELKELAPRDIVAKAINDQKLMGRSVYVDVTHFTPGSFQNRFPNIYEHCLENGIDPLKEPIPVTPVEHYYMGGISCNANGEVCNSEGRVNIKGLYASGETASTGFHGANRLASNSLLECLTLSLRVTELINNEPVVKKSTNSDSGILFRSKGPEISIEKLGEIQNTFRDLFAETFTIVKESGRIKAALNHFDNWLEQLSPVQSDTVAYTDLYNGLMIAREIAIASLKRPHSLGAFIWKEAEKDKE